MKCEPASRIVALLGGTAIVSNICSISVTQVQRWQYPSAKGGTDGYIPRKYHERLTLAAADRGIALPSAAFVDPLAVPAPVHMDAAS